MKRYHQLSLLSLTMIMAAQSAYANNTERKELTTNTAGGANTSLSTGLTTLDDKTDSGESQNPAKKRFIPVELFTGAKWDGKHQLTLKDVSNVACATVSGRKRACDKYYITGPFKTKENNSKIAWAGDQVSYYQRIYSTPRAGEVKSFFTINNSKDGLVRIYDKRKKWGERVYDGLGSKFPLGYWQQGEVRSYPSRRPTRIEIIELYGPNHCLSFRWTVGLGKKRNQDNIYTFCPERGFTNVRHVNEKNNAKK